MSNARPELEERYTRGGDVVNFVVYKSTTGIGHDEVLQHKLLGTTETAHVTLHADGSVNFRVTRGRQPLETIIRTGLNGFAPRPSARLQTFLRIVQQKI